jgi:FkbM family methyltransferase
MHLCANILANRLPNVRVLHHAVGVPARPADSIEVPLFDVFSERFTGSVSLDRDVQGIRGRVDGVAEPAGWAREHDRVRLVSLDEVCADLQVSFVKVDVEGMELQVLRSGENLLRSQRPTLFFEAWLLPEFAAMRRDLLQYVMGLGYAILQINDDCLAYHPQALSPASVFAALERVGLRMPAQAA